MTRILSDADLTRLQAHIVSTGSPVGFTPTPRKRRRNEESRIQQAVIRWWSAAHGTIPEWALYAIPNGGRRDAITGFMMKKEGVRSGIPDLFLSVPKGNRSGLYLEMKTPAGVLSPEQRAILPVLNTLGYETAVCRSSEEAIRVIERYLGARA